MELLKRENIQICETALDWCDAIRIAVMPLEKNGYVETRYKEEIISNVEKFGPYIVIADNVALPHARPEQGALVTQVSVTLFREAIPFSNGEVTAKLFITLAAQDSSSHLDILMKISEILSDESVTSKILESPDVETLYQYFKRGGISC